MTRKSVLRSVRLDDDVWEAVKAMPCSLNQYLKTSLLGGLVKPDLVASPGFRRGVAEAKARLDKFPVSGKATSAPSKSPLLKPKDQKK